MKRLTFEVAGPGDEAALRQLLRENPMPGSIRIAFTREPHYLQAAEVEGSNIDIAIARADGRIVGFGSRAIKTCYVNGEACPLAYFSGLRIDPHYRNGLLLGRGYAFMRRLAEQRPARVQITTIIETNLPAIRTLSSGKGQLPAYEAAGRYYTLAYRPGRPVAKQRHYRIRFAAPADTDRIIAFLNTHGRRRQFFPVYSAADLSNGDGLLRNLRCEDILLCEENRQICGTLALWDQKPFKQSIITGYPLPVRLARPWYNGIAALRRLPALPAAGSALSGLSAALVCVEEDRADVFGALLAEALRQAGGRAGIHSLLLGLHEQDPLLPIARMLPHIAYKSRLFGVYWQDGRAAWQALDRRIPYLELGAL